MPTINKIAITIILIKKNQENLKTIIIKKIWSDI